jgi:hypothetical protein
MNRGQRRAGWLARHRQGASGTAPLPLSGQGPQGRIAGPAAVRLHIEELVLHGFAPADRHAIGDAVQQELTRLLREHGVAALLARGGETERLDAGSFPLAPDARPQVIGAGVARAVHGGTKS